MRRLFIHRIFFILGGTLIFVVGILGLILPILPGWPLIAVGASMAAPTAYFRLKYKKLYPFLRRDVVYFSEWRGSGVDAGVTTKFFPLKLQKTDDLDAPANQAKLRAAFARSDTLSQKKLSLGDRFAYLQQVHGGEVAVISGPEYREPGFHRFAGTDGAITNVPGLALVAMTADCLSVFLCAPGWVGVVHAGWRGTKAGIVAKACRLIQEKSGTKEIRAIFGPSICAKHYQVGEEFLKDFSAPSLKLRKGRLCLDIALENKRQLVEAGVHPDDVSVSGFCTISQNDHFYSFRKEKENAGRMISFIRLRPTA